MRPSNLWLWFWSIIGFLTHAFIRLLGWPEGIKPSEIGLHLYKFQIGISPRSWTHIGSRRSLPQNKAIQKVGRLLGTWSNGQKKWNTEWFMRTANQDRFTSILIYFGSNQKLLIDAWRCIHACLMWQKIHIIQSLRNPTLLCFSLFISNSKSGFVWWFSFKKAWCQLLPGWISYILLRRLISAPFFQF